MAYQTTFEYYGKEYPDAYFRITDVRYFLEDIEVYDSETESIVWETEPKGMAVASVYADKNARMKNVQPLRKLAFEFSYDDSSSEGIIAQAYTYLTEDSEYSGGNHA